MKIEQKTRYVSNKQWDQFIPAKDLAAHLRRMAFAIRRLPAGVRGKIHVTVTLAKKTSDKHK